jgi:hypothetical protein
MNRKMLISLTVFMLATLACSVLSPNTVVGSGNVVSEKRNVSGFTSIELKSPADVNITIGTTESAVIKADDNILPLIETNVSNEKLVIGNQVFKNIRASHPIQISITMKSLRGIAMSGSGSMNASGLVGQDLVVDLPGSGDITLTGTANNVTINLPGSGNIFCDGLKASSAIVTLNGSGNITVFASESLDANIRGSGAIRYNGNPAQVKKNISGSGTISP